MPTESEVKTIGPWTPRRNLVNGFVLATECAAVRGELTWWNAECNIRDLNRMFPTHRDMLDLCRQVGIEPLATLPPKLGPRYPRANAALGYHYDVNVQPHSGWRDYEGEPCEHRWIYLQWSGYDCNDCGRHFGG